MTAEAGQLWGKVDGALQKRLNPEMYSHWISVIEPKTIESDTLVLAVDNDFYLWWIEEHYMKLIAEVVTRLAGEAFKVRLVVDSPDAGTTAARHVPAASKKRVGSDKAPKRASAAGTPLNPKCVFDTFVVGPSNSFSHASSLAVAQAPGRAYNPLFLYGGIGLGKTHLMQAIGQYVSTRSTASVCYVSCETMLNDYISSLQNKKAAAFRRKYRTTDVLLIDDVHFLSGKNGLQEEFFHTFNQLFNARKQIVMTSDRAAGDIAGLEKRLVSRFEWGLVSDLSPPDFETRVAILQSKLESMNIIFPEEVVRFIASHIKSNIRKLEGALTRITSYASMAGRPVTMDLAQEQLRHLLEHEKAEPAGIPAIQRKVADHFDIRVSDMVGVRRNNAVTVPRQMAMYLCRSMTTASFPEIGAAFEKTHATVMHACKLIERKRSEDPQFDRLLVSFARQLDPDRQV